MKFKPALFPVFLKLNLNIISLTHDTKEWEILPPNKRNEVGGHLALSAHRMTGLLHRKELQRYRSGIQRKPEEEEAL